MVIDGALVPTSDPRTTIVVRVPPTPEQVRGPMATPSLFFFIKCLTAKRPEGGWVYGRLLRVRARCIHVNGREGGWVINRLDAVSDDASCRRTFRLAALRPFPAPSGFDLGILREKKKGPASRWWA